MLEWEGGAGDLGRGKGSVSDLEEGSVMRKYVVGCTPSREQK